MAQYSKRAIKLSNRINNIINNHSKTYQRINMVEGIINEQHDTHTIYNERYVITEEHHPELHKVFKSAAQISNNLYNLVYKVERLRFLNGDRKIYCYKELKEVIGQYKNSRLTKVLLERNEKKNSLVEYFFNAPKSIRLGTLYDATDIWYRFYTTNKRIEQNNDNLHRIPLPKYRKGIDRRYTFTINHNKIEQIENNNESKYFSNSKFQYLLKLPYDITENQDLYLATNIHIGSIIDVRITPNRNRFIVDIKYQVEKNLSNRYSYKDIYKVDRDRIAGIDFGVSNLIAIANNIGVRPLLIDGKRLSAINNYYNNLMSKYTSVKKLSALKKRHTNKVNDYLNKAARITINYLEKHMIKTLVLGISNLVHYGFINDYDERNFISIDYNYLINRIKLLCFQHNINVVEVDEDYTSTTSIFDGQLPTKDNHMMIGKRFTDRLYITQNFGIINCDINSAIQIICKYKSDAFDKILAPLKVMKYRRPIKYKNLSIADNCIFDSDIYNNNIIVDYTHNTINKVYFGKNGSLTMNSKQFIDHLIELYKLFGFKTVASKALYMTNNTIRKLMGVLITPIKCKIAY